MSFTKTKETHGMSRKCLVSTGTALIALLVSRVGLEPGRRQSDSADPDDKDRR